MRSAHWTSVSPQILNDIVARIVAVARPESIILFGSGASGEWGRTATWTCWSSNVGADRGRLTERIYLRLEGAGEAVDIIVVTPGEVEQYRDTRWLVIASALREGRVVYAA